MRRNKCDFKRKSQFRTATLLVTTSLVCFQPAARYLCRLDETSERDNLKI